MRPRLQPTRLLCPWDFPGKSTGVGSHHLLRSRIQEDSLKINNEPNISILKKTLIFLNLFELNLEAMYKYEKILTSYYYRASLVAQMVRSLPAARETQVQPLDWEDPLEKEMATHSRILAWKIPWTEEPGGLQSIGLQRIGHDWATSLYHYKWKIESEFNNYWAYIQHKSFSNYALYIFWK